MSLLYLGVRNPYLQGCRGFTLLGAGAFEILGNKSLHSHWCVVKLLVFFNALELGYCYLIWAVP